MLELLARTPLLWTAAVRTLGGLSSDDTAYRCLDRMGERGLVSWLRPPLWGRNSPRLYHLTDLGVAVAALRREVDPVQLARSHGLRGEDLLAELPGLPYLVALYELAAGLVPEGGRLAEWRRPWRRYYHKPTAKALQRVSLPAYAEISTDADRTAPYLLLPDVGERPLASFELALSGVVDYMAFRRGDLPDLVVATTSEGRALAWRELLEQARRDRGTAPLPARVFTWEEVGDGLRGRLPPRLPAKRHIAPLDLDAVEPAGQGRSLPRPVSTGLARRRAGAGGAALELSPDCRELLALVGRHPFLGTGDLATLTGRRTGTMARLAAHLARSGLVRKIGEDELGSAASGIEVVELTREGLSVVAAQAGLTPAAAVRFNHLSGGGPEAPFGQRRALARDPEHTLGTNRVFVALYRVAAQWQSRGYAYRVLEWRSAAACAQGDVRPDGYGVLGLGPVRYAFELEYDRGTEQRRDLLAKFYAYQRRLTTGRGETFPTLLVVTQSRDSEQRVADAVLIACALSGQPLPVLITTHARIGTDSNGLLGRIWREPVNRGRRHWLVRPVVAPFGYGCPPSEPFARTGDSR